MNTDQYDSHPPSLVPNSFMRIGGERVFVGHVNLVLKQLMFHTHMIGPVVYFERNKQRPAKNMPFTHTQSPRPFSKPYKDVVSEGGYRPGEIPCWSGDNPHRSKSLSVVEIHTEGNVTSLNFRKDE